MQEPLTNQQWKNKFDVLQNMSEYVSPYSVKNVFAKKNCDF